MLKVIQSTNSFSAPKDACAQTKRTHRISVISIASLLGGCVLAVVIALGLLPAATGAEVFQYAARVKSADGKECVAYLWTPPQARRIRGVLVGGMILMEEQFVADPLIRQVCQEQQLAIVYFVPHLDAKFEYQQGNGELLEEALKKLADASGYDEIRHAPLFPFGHSVATIFARNVAFWRPQRCFGVLLFKGGMGFPAFDPQANVLGVPILVVKGQFEEFGPGPSGVLRDFEDRQTAWKNTRDGLLKLRQKDQQYLLSLLVEPGGTHFAWSEPVARFSAMFLRKAAQRRIAQPADHDGHSVTPRQSSQSPGVPAAGETVGSVCRRVDFADGVLASGTLEKPEAPPAPYSQYKGEPGSAFWHFDLELAQASQSIHKDLFARQPQFVTFADPRSGKPIYVGHDLRLRLSPFFVSADTLKVAAVFLDKPPDKYPRSDAPVGHAEGPIRFRAFSGPIEQVSPNLFRIRFSRHGRLRAGILAYHPGDARYRYAEQPGLIQVAERLTKGSSQRINFSPVGPLRPDSPPALLQATSDSGLPVRYYVDYGPAVVEDNRLRIVDVPCRARFPMEIVVVAYQYGSAVEPYVQTAEPVRQVISLERP